MKSLRGKGLPVLVCLGAGLCVCAALAARETRTPPDTLVVASDLNPIRNLSPGATYVRNALTQLNNVYDRLIVSEADGCGRTGIAESFEVSDDGREYVFRIREGLRFHSGNPVRAEDVAFSLQRVTRMGRAMTRFTSAIGLVADSVDSQIVATGPYEVRLRLSEPLAPNFVLNVIASPVSFIVDKEVVMSHAVDGDLGHEWLSRHSAGSGPFRIRDWEPRQWLILEAAGQNPAALAKVVVRDVQEPTLRRLLVSKGDADMATDLSADQLVALEQNPDVRIASEAAARVIYLVLNQAHANLSKPQVRRAINLLIDREQIAETMLKGTFRAHQGFWPEGLWASFDDPVYRYDPIEARRLLAAAGFPDGLRVELDASTLYPYPQIAQSMQAMQARGGVTLDLIFSDDAQNLTKMMNRRFSGMIMRSYYALFPDPHDAADWFVVNRDNSDDAQVNNAAWRASYVNEALMDLADRALRETDTERRRLMYLDMQQSLQRDGAISILFQQVHSVALRSNVSGYCQGPLLDQLNYFNVVKH